MRKRNKAGPYLINSEAVRLGQGRGGLVNSLLHMLAVLTTKFIFQGRDLTPQANDCGCRLLLEITTLEMLLKLKPLPEQHGMSHL